MPRSAQMPKLEMIGEGVQGVGAGTLGYARGVSEEIGA